MKRTADAVMTDAESEVVMPSGFRRVDLVRLMTQCLSTLGYTRAAELLQEESVTVELPGRCRFGKGSDIVPKFYDYDEDEAHEDDEASENNGEDNASISSSEKDQ